MNPFTYYKAPETRKQAQSNVNYWHFEGMLSNDEMEELGHIPASFKAFINEMKHEAKKTLIKIEERTA